MDILDKEEEKKIVGRWLENLAITCEYSDDEETEKAIRQVAFAGGVERHLGTKAF